MKKLLLAENDVIVAKLCADDFLHSGFYVEVTTEGASALSAIDRLKPDVVILGYFLSDLTAPEVLTQLRAKPETNSIPVVVLAPPQSSANADLARKAGANKFVSRKQGWDGDLRAAVRELLAPPAQETLSPEEPEPASVDNPPPKKTPAQKAAPAVAPPKVLASSSLKSLEGIEKMKALSLALSKTEKPEDQIALLGELFREAPELLNTAAVAKAALVTSLAKAFFALLEDLVQRPQNIGPSPLRTIRQTVQSFESLSQNGSSGSLETAANQFAVLGVDDDPAVRRLVTRALGNIEIKAETTGNPLQAVELATRQLWDLFILDVNMPNMSGFDLCAKLRALPSHTKTPVVFLTACNDIEHRLRFARSKADDFIAKPFLLPELNVKVLGQLLGVALKRVAQKQDLGGFRSFKG
jgi:CheY-like chemotaxis protein